LSVFSIYLDTRVPVTLWMSWEDTHYHFSEVDLIPAVIWRSDPMTQLSIELTRWTFPFCAILFFLLFGFAQEAQKNYSRLFWWIASQFGFQPQPTTPKPTTIPRWRNVDVTSYGSRGPPPSYRSESDNKRRTESFSSGSEIHTETDIEKVADSHLQDLADLKDTESTISSSVYHSTQSFGDAGLSSPQSSDFTHVETTDLKTDSLKISDECLIYLSTKPLPPSPTPTFRPLSDHNP